LFDLEKDRVRESLNVQGLELSLRNSEMFEIIFSLKNVCLSDQSIFPEKEIIFSLLNHIMRSFKKIGVPLHRNSDAKYFHRS